MVYFLLAIFSNWLRHGSINSHYKRFSEVIVASTSLLPSRLRKTSSEQGKSGDCNEDGNAGESEATPTTAATSKRLNLDKTPSGGTLSCGGGGGGRGLSRQRVVSVDENGQIMMLTSSNSFDSDTESTVSEKGEVER